jgi:SAM-dependent methyltransferase
MHRNSVLLFERYAKPLLKPGLTVLEIGPDGDPSTYCRLAGSDLDWRTADLAPSVFDARRYNYATAVDKLTYPMPDEYTIQAPTGAFDVVLSGQVIEHVRRIWVWMQELARVCKSGGYVVTINPVSWPHHEAPIDCWRIYPDGMIALCEDAGLEVVLSKCEGLESTPSRRTYPGQTFDYAVEDTRSTRAKRRLKTLLGWPMSTSLDTVTIARKP